MIQSFQTQMQVSLRALREVVAPALDPGNKQAVEQLQLALVTLDFMRQRLAHARRYHRVELSHLLGLARRVSALLGDVERRPLGAAITAGEGELARPEAEIEDYLIVSRDLRELISEIVAEAVGQPFEAALDALVVEATEYLLVRERVWCLPFGLELKPESLPNLDQLLDESEGYGARSK